MKVAAAGLALMVLGVAVVVLELAVTVARVVDSALGARP